MINTKPNFYPFSRKWTEEGDEEKEKERGRGKAICKIC